jgi:hypothetical protein
MKLTITMDVYEDYADPTHEIGLSEYGFQRMFEALIPFGDDVQFSRSWDTSLRDT